MGVVGLGVVGLVVVGLGVVGLGVGRVDVVGRGVWASGLVARAWSAWMWYRASGVVRLVECAWEGWCTGRVRWRYSRARVCVPGRTRHSGVVRES